MLAVAFIALVIALCVWVLRPPLVIVELARPPKSINPDHDIFDLVLADLIENPEFNPATGGRDVKKRQSVFGKTTNIGSSNALLIRGWVREMGISQELEDVLRSRNPKRAQYFLADYRPSNPNILLRDLSAIDRDIMGFYSRFPDASGYVETWLPGYSRDGQTALLSFTFGPNPHGAVGCYVLRKTNGCWKISERRIRYFL
jgi:hypothetical protein